MKTICEILTSVPICDSDIYDIVKAHGGELKVETKEGEGSEFLIHIPQFNINEQTI
jgi:K+-sensing histidine kinase KdpD